MKQLLIILSLILFLSGCVPEVECNKPYIKVGTECCLDTNNNLVCDSDEEIIEEEVILEKICPTSCNDNKKCTKDHCSKETDFECKYDEIINCCGNDICEEKENSITCSEDCEAISLENMENILNNYYDTKDTFRRNKLTVQHNFSFFNLTTDYDFYDSQYALIIKIKNKSKLIKNSDEFKTRVIELTDYRTEIRVKDSKRRLLERNNKTYMEEEDLKYKKNVTYFDNVKFYSYKGFIIGEYNYYGLVYQVKEGSEFTVMDPYYPYGDIWMYIYCSPKLIVQVHKKSYESLLAYWPNYSEEKMNEELQDSINIDREDILKRAKAILDVCYEE